MNTIEILLLIGLVCFAAYAIYERGLRIQAENDARVWFFEAHNKPRPIVVKCGHKEEKCTICNHEWETVDGTVPYIACKKCFIRKSE